MSATLLVAPATTGGAARRFPMPFSSGNRPILAAAGRQAAAAVRLARHHKLAQQPSQRAPLCRAADGEGQQSPPEAAPESSSAAGSSPAAAAPKREAPVDPSVAKGQRTAIITGAISIIFGVIYLALVSFLDMRGGEMLPPPPEAFEYM